MKAISRHKWDWETVILFSLEFFSPWMQALRQCRIFRRLSKQMHDTCVLASTPCSLPMEAPRTDLWHLLHSVFYSEMKIKRVGVDFGILLHSTIPRWIVLRSRLSPTKTKGRSPPSRSTCLTHTTSIVHGIVQTMSCLHARWVRSYIQAFGTSSPRRDPTHQGQVSR